MATGLNGIEESRLLEMKALLERSERHMDIESRPDLSRLVNWRGSDALPIHRWFRYREGFSPNLISALQLGESLLDPFCGCGSIMVGAAVMNRRAVGIDLNPLAIFVAKVKLSPLGDKEAGAVREFVCNFDRLVGTFRLQWPTPELTIASKVFEPLILEELMSIRALIEQYSEVSAVHEFLLLAWISILQDVGSYFKEGNGIKYRNKKRLKSGYVRREEGVWQHERFGANQRSFVRQTFLQQLNMMCDDMDQWRTGNWANQVAIHGNALKMNTLLENQKFDSVIFSPPYANRFDYFESMKVELWFGGFVRSYSDLQLLRKQSVRSNLGAALGESSIDLPELELLIGLMNPESSSWRMGVPSALRGYFADMLTVIKECRRVCNGPCYIVVGNSAYAGVIIPVDSLIAELGRTAGYSSSRVVAVRHLTVAPQQRSTLRSLEAYMRESVVILEP